MALLNGMYLPVIEETVTREIETVAHPVETGIDITDHVKKKPTEISLSGEVVGNSAENILSQIAEMNKTGVVITYVGRNYFRNGQIISFETGHTHAIWGGCTFEMVIREVRFAGSAYDPSAAPAPDGTEPNAAQQAASTHRPASETNNAGVQQRERYSTSPEVTHTSKNGETTQTIAQSYNMKYAEMYARMKENTMLEKERGHNYIPADTKIAVATRSGSGNY